MTDLELLEKAARAAGNEYDEMTECWSSDGIEWEQWLPLEDDGDAYRLLFSIRADVYHGTNEYEEPIITFQPEGLSLIDAPSALRDSPNSIRRAIVRAAAAMADECTV